jgi:HK97 family phage prohead protease
MSKSDEAPEVGQTFTANFKVEIETAEKVGDRGKVTALVSVYDLPYRMGFATYHQIEFGAFAKSLAQNANVPLFWQHNWSWSEQPPIGVGTASESERGLVVEGELFLDTEAGRSVFNAMKAGALREWSIGYQINRYEIEEGDEFDTIHAKEIELLEASSVLRGANPETETLKVASEADVIGKLTEVVEIVTKLSAAVAELQQEQLDSLERVDILEVQAIEDSEVITSRLHDLEAEVFDDVEASPPEGAVCVNDDCSAPATTTSPTEDHDIVEWVCEEHSPFAMISAGLAEIIGKFGTAASSGEGVQDEPAPVEGGEPEAATASVPAPQVPDFLPPLPVEDTEFDADVSQITRVMRAWNKSEREAEVSSLINRATREMKHRL